MCVLHFTAWPRAHNPNCLLDVQGVVAEASSVLNQLDKVVAEFHRWVWGCRIGGTLSRPCGKGMLESPPTTHHAPPPPRHTHAHLAWLLHPPARHGLFLFTWGDSNNDIEHYLAQVRPGECWWRDKWVGRLAGECCWGGPAAAAALLPAPVAAADFTALRHRPPSLPLPPCPLQKQAGLDGIIFDDVAKVAKVRPGAKGGKGAFSICGLSTLSLLHGLRDLRLLLPPGPAAGPTCLCATSRPPLCRALPCQRAARNPPPKSTICSTFHSTRTPDRWDQKPCGCPRPPQ